MTTLFGLPLIGSSFLPLIIGIVTVFFFWTFIASRKSSQSYSKDEDVIKEFSVPNPKVVLETKKNTKDKKKKSCGSSGGCCSKKDGKSGGCSDLNKAIQNAKVFVDVQSNICQEFAVMLSKQLTEKLATEVINIIESVDLAEHADGSFCIFIIDTSVSNGQPHWLLKALNNLENTEKPLSRMKYSVFTVQAAPLESKADTVDQMLHKSGAVRMCRAEIADITTTGSLHNFDEWATELLSQIQRWNSPSKKACKCGPKKKTKDENDSCSSSNCSSEDESQRHSSPSKSILDLEDIGKLL